MHPLANAASRFVSIYQHDILILFELYSVRQIGLPLSKPNHQLITISDNQRLIVNLLRELVLNPRINALRWSKLTKQTPNMKIGYPAQHLASLIAGVEGVRTGARGDDLADGTEIKSCSRVDQLDNCRDCKQKLLRIEQACPHCGSTNINRMNDSKWLFAIKSQEELDLLTSRIDRVLLMIADYPLYDEGDFESIRFQAFEIWNNEERHKNFRTLMSNYYHKIFLEHIKKNPNKTPAPKNLWPYSYQFYLCNPLKVFEANVTDANNNPTIEVSCYVEPNTDRSQLRSEDMPSTLLNVEELQVLADHANTDVVAPLLANGFSFEDFRQLTSEDKVKKPDLIKILPFLDQEARSVLPLRDTDKIATEKVKYRRR